MWRGAIRIDEEQLWRRWSSTAATWTTKLSTATAGTIDELATVGADLIRSDVVSECRRTTFTQSITHQFVATSTTAAATSDAGRSRCFHEKHLAINTGLKIEVLTLRHVRYGDDPLR